MARRTPTTKAQRSQAYAYPCPTCLASPGSTCIRPRGKRYRPHLARLERVS